MKSLRKRLEKQGRTKLCPADVRAVMGEFGWLPKDDPNDVKFTMLLMENLDPEEQDLIVPMSVFDGKGGTTLPKGRRLRF